MINLGRRLVASMVVIAIFVTVLQAANAASYSPVISPSLVDFGEVLPPKNTPVFLGGTLSGSTTDSVIVDGIGEVTATVNNETGEIQEVYPDGTVTYSTVEQRAHDLQEIVSSATEEQKEALTSSIESRITKDQVCPYLVASVGAIHDMTWNEALKMAAVNPAITILVGFGQIFFWTWVGTHC